MMRQSQKESFAMNFNEFYLNQLKFSMSNLNRVREVHIVIWNTKLSSYNLSTR